MRFPYGNLLVNKKLNVDLNFPKSNKTHQQPLHYEPDDSDIQELNIVDEAHIYDQIMHISAPNEDSTSFEETENTSAKMDSNTVNK